MDPQQTPETFEVEAATRLSRLGAALLDGLLALAPLGAIAVMVPMALLSGRMGALLAFIIAAGVITLAVLVTQIVLLVRNGQTIGKKILGIRMITSSGETPSIWRVFFLRWLPFFVVAMVVEMVVKVRGLGNIIHVLDALLIFQSTRRCMHDLIADTHVIKA